MNDEKPSDHGTDLSPHIRDARFYHQLTQVRKLKCFLFEEKIKINKDQLQTIDLGELNNFIYDKNGRVPSQLEWRLLDEKLSAITLLLNDDLKTRIRISDLGIFFGQMPLLFLGFTTISTIGYGMLEYVGGGGGEGRSDSITYIFLYLVTAMTWTLSQGGLGACAYLATRVAMKTNEVAIDTPDLTDRNVLRTRLILGPLFAFLIGTPVSILALDRILKGLALFEHSETASPLSASDFAIILIPFLLGFSTSLVLAIFDRTIIGIRTIFGLSSSK